MRLRVRAAAGAVGLLLLAGPASVADAADPARPLIAIDVGHSTAKPGATSARGRPEFEFNRGLALVVERALRRHGWPTLLIGAQGEIDALALRTAAAAMADAGFLLSLHHDSVQPHYLDTWTVDGREQRFSDRFSGFSVFVSHRNPAFADSLGCARAIGRALRARGFAPTLHHAEPIQGENRPLLDAENGVYAYDGLAVLRGAAMPAVLLEAGIIVNRDDESALRQPATRERIAGAISDALSACLSG